jgi:hypothetical protein
MAFLLGNQIVLHDAEIGDLESLRINGTDVLTHDGSTISLKNVDINDAIEGTINTDNLTEGSTNLFFTDARAISAVQGQPINLGSNNITTTGNILYSNVYALEGDLPNATTYHGMFAHVHGTGKGYFSHAGNWVALANESSLPANTDVIAEGSTNLYYTDARADVRAQAKVDALVDAAPGTLDTLNELAAALGDDANFSTTVTNLIGAEATTARAAEVANATAIAAETNRAAGIEGGLGSAIGSNGVAIANEAARAVAAEQANATAISAIPDWTAASAGTIDPSNYVNTGNTTYTAGNGLNLNTTEFEMSGNYTGNFTATGDITAYSDKRLKRNIETISNPIDLVNCLRGVNFEKDGRYSTGVIAQEVEEFLPEVVHTDADGMKSVAYGNITGLLIEAIKEQQKTIDSLQEQIDKLNKI